MVYDCGGSATPSFTPEVVEKALRALEERIALHNRALEGAARVSKAVAYGDFLLKLSRVQAADVGIELSPPAAEAPVNAARNEQRKIFQELRAKSRHFRLLAFLPWMEERSHLALVPKTPKSSTLKLGRPETNRVTKNGCRIACRLVRPMK